MRMLGTVLFGLAVGYALLTGLVYFRQDAMVFLPEIGGRSYALTPAAAGLPFERVQLATEDGERLAAWFVPGKPGSDRVALICHGNAGNISHRLEYLLMFHRMGMASLVFDYRGYGESSGRPSEEGTYRDAQAAWRHLTAERGYPSGRVVLLGESLGGAVAAWLAARERPGALVLSSTFTSVPDMGAKLYPFLPVRLLARLRYDALESVRRVAAPVLVAHSRDDEIVPYAQGRALYDAAPGPKRFLELAGGHNDGFIFVREEWARELRAFLDAQLPAAAPGGGG